MPRRTRPVLGWLEEIEEAMRALGRQLDDAEASAAASWSMDAWPDRHVRKARRELARRALGVPFLRRLIETASEYGDELTTTPEWLGVRRWRDGEVPDDLSSVKRLQPTAAARPADGWSPSGEAPARIRIAERAIRQRTRALVPVLAHPENPMNASAVLRTAEALGLQEIHLVHREGAVLPVRAITKTCERWIDVRRWRSTTDAFAALREEGRRVWVADFDPEARPLGEIPWEHPVALVFGGEQRGVDEETRRAADGLFYVPTAGFTSYLNLAATAAIALWETDRRLRAAGKRTPLDESERDALRRAWYPALASQRFRAAEYAAWADTPPDPAPLVKPVPSRERATQPRARDEE